MFLQCRFVPGSRNHSRFFLFGEAAHIDTVHAVNGYAASSGNETDDFIPGQRVAAFSETDRHVIRSFHHDTALDIDGFRLLRLRFGHGFYHFFIGHGLLVIALVKLHHLVKDLALF